MIQQRDHELENRAKRIGQRPSRDARGILENRKSPLELGRDDRSLRHYLLRKPIVGICSTDTSSADNATDIVGEGCEVFYRCRETGYTGCLRLIVLSFIDKRHK